MSIVAGTTLLKPLRRRFLCHKTRRLLTLGPAQAGLRIPESYDGNFELSGDSDSCLRQLLSSPAFQKQVEKETGQMEGTSLEFTGRIFQPVPWSPKTRLGMPQELEKFHADPDFVIINIPPNFLFKAKIFKPSRLCTIYRKRNAQEHS